MLRGTQSLLAFTVLGSTFLVLTTSAGAGSTSLVFQEVQGVNVLDTVTVTPGSSLDISKTPGTIVVDTQGLNGQLKRFAFLDPPSATFSSSGLTTEVDVNAVP